jgi:hypothetical protein
MSEKDPLISDIEELSLLMEQPGVPCAAIDCFLQLFEFPQKFICLKYHRAPAPGTNKGRLVFEATDLLTDFVAAVRARDWPRIGIIEHGLRS